MTCASSLPWKSVCSTWRRTQSGQRVCSPQTEGVKCIGNTLTIGKKCEKDGLTLKTLIHEFGHVLGLYHEMNRGDRDQYIEILDGRLKKKFESNFKLPFVHPKTLNTPYDFLSVMHYSQYAFTQKKGCVTMRTKDKCAQNLIGKTKVASFYDIKTGSKYDVQMQYRLWQPQLRHMETKQLRQMRRWSRLLLGSRLCLYLSGEVADGFALFAAGPSAFQGVAGE